MENLVVCTGAWLGLCSLIWLDYLTTEQNHIVTMYIIPVILIIVKQATISSHYAHIQIHIQTVFLRLLDPQFLHQASQLVYYLLEFLPNNAPGPDDTSFPDVCWVLTFHFQTAFHIPRKWTQTAKKELRNTSNTSFAQKISSLCFTWNTTFKSWKSSELLNDISIQCSSKSWNGVYFVAENICREFLRSVCLNANLSVSRYSTVCFVNKTLTCPIIVPPNTESFSLTEDGIKI